MTRKEYIVKLVKEDIEYHEYAVREITAGRDTIYVTPGEVDAFLNKHKKWAIFGKRILEEITKV